MNDRHIIGFESASLDELTVAYGVAAIRAGDEFVNPALPDHPSPMSEWSQLVSDGHVVELPVPIYLPPELTEAPCYVAVAQVEFVGILLHFAKKELGDVVWCFLAWPGTIGLIFPSWEELERVALATSDHVRNVILVASRCEGDLELRERWTRFAQILDPWDGLGQEEWCRRFRESRDH
jgi:hypothetical protein